MLIVVSAGNHSESVTLDFTADEIANVAEAERQSAAVVRVHAEGLHRRLLAPAESMSTLTIGASASDAAGGLADQRLDLFVVRSLPAPYSARGTGFGRSVKPGALYPGGRVRYEPPLPGTAAPTEPTQVERLRRRPGFCLRRPARQDRGPVSCTGTARLRLRRSQPGQPVWHARSLSGFATQAQTIHASTRRNGLSCSRRWLLILVDGGRHERSTSRPWGSNAPP